MPENERYQVTRQSSLYNIKFAYNNFLTELSAGGVRNIISNPFFDFKNLDNAQNPVLTGWSHDGVWTKAGSYITFNLEQDEKIWQDLTDKLHANFDHSIFLRVRTNQDVTLRLSCSDFSNVFLDLSNEDAAYANQINKDLLAENEQGEIGVFNDYFFPINVNNTNLEGKEILFEIVSRQGGTTVDIAFIVLKAGLAEIADSHYKDHFLENVRYNVTTGQWELSNDGVNYGAFSYAGPASDADHNHDFRYYLKDEVDDLLANAGANLSFSGLEAAGLIGPGEEQIAWGAHDHLSSGDPNVDYYSQASVNALINAAISQAGISATVNSLNDIGDVFTPLGNLTQGDLIEWDGVQWTYVGKDSLGFAAETHEINDHPDTAATGAQLNTLTQNGDASFLHVHQVETLDTDATGAQLTQLTDGSDASTLHNHTVASLNDTIATGANLDILVNGSNADTLHTHDFASVPGVGNWAYLTSFEAVNQPTIDFLGIDTYSYWRYMFVFENIEIDTTAGSAIHVRLSLDNGVNWQGDPSNPGNFYAWTYSGFTGGTSAGTGGVSQPYIRLTNPNLSNEDYYAYSGYVYMHNPNSTLRHTSFLGKMESFHENWTNGWGFVDNTGVYHGGNPTPGPVVTNAVRFYVHNDLNFISGRIALYGWNPGF